MGRAIGQTARFIQDTDIGGRMQEPVHLEKYT